MRYVWVSTHTYSYISELKIGSFIYVYVNDIRIKIL